VASSAQKRQPYAEAKDKQTTRCALRHLHQLHCREQNCDSEAAQSTQPFRMFNNKHVSINTKLSSM